VRRPWLEAYRRWRAAAVGAATARGPGVRDVEIRTVGAFGVIGGRDCCKRAPSHFYSVVRGRGLNSSTFQLDLSRIGHTLLVPLSNRLGENHAPNVSQKLCLR